MTTSKSERWFLLVWSLVTAWIFFCAFVVQGEYGDGYQTVVNARYLFGESPTYYVQRGPLAAVVLWPVEVVVRVLEINPISVQPHHVLSALLHSMYLVAVWLLLQRAPGSTEAKLLAFGAAILSVVFYAYAPYLSHDLLPGLLFLVLIFLSHRWLNKRAGVDALYLVILGAAVTLIKQTYAIFWVSIILYALLAMIFKWDEGRVTLRRLVEFGLLALSSAVISWLGYAWFIGGELPDAAFLTRPIKLIAAVSAQYGDDIPGLFAADLYLRNLPNYGILAMLLVVPGLLLALRGSDARMRQIAVCWIVAIVVMQSLGFREVRYLAFLAPLTAMLIVPVLQCLFVNRLAISAALLLLLFDQSRGIIAASEPLTSSARIDVARFIDSPSGNQRIVASNVLSFAYSAASPLARDRYHGIYHLTPLLISGLYENQIPIEDIADPRALGRSGIEAGDRVFYSNNNLVRLPPWADDNQPAGLPDLIVVAGDAIDSALVLRLGEYERVDNDGSYVMFLPDPNVDMTMPVISRGKISVAAAAQLYGDVTDRDRLQVIAVSVSALCQADICSYR